MINFFIKLSFVALKLINRENIMNKIILTFLFCLYASFLSAQQMYLTNINGDPVLTKTYTEIIGSAFLSDNWIYGTVTTINGKTYKNINLKYDLFKDEPYFKQKENDEGLYAFTEKIKTFTLVNLGVEETYLMGFPAVDNYTPDSYYQVLGKINENYFLKKTIKTISESRPYNSSTTEKTFIELQVYYLFKDGKMIKFKPSKKEFLANFPAQSEKINAYLKTNDVDFKNGKDLGGLFSHILGAN
jgi:hypothetical protein